MHRFDSQDDGKKPGCRNQTRYSRSAAQTKKRLELSLPESAVHLLLHYPHLHAHAALVLPRLRQGGQQEELLWLVQLIELLQEHPQASRSRLLGLWHGRFGDNGSARLYELADRESLIASELLAARSWRIFWTGCWRLLKGIARWIC
jgi:hypothetical protein